MRTLYFVRRGSGLPWPSIARELALALSREADPGRLAAGIKEVLAATSETAAAEMLDELGFAPLAVSEQQASVDSAVVDDFGGEDAPLSERPEQSEFGAQGDFATSGASSGANGTPPGEGFAQLADEPPTGTPNPSTGGQPPTPGGSVARPLGRSGRPPTPLSSQPEEQLESSAEGAGRDRGATGMGERPDGESQGQRRVRGSDSVRRPSRGGYPVLRSYVSHEDPEADREVDPELAELRECVDRHGINRVLEYERQHGRHAREMPPCNPGYDVESVDEAGQVVRYIEVKSLSGDWEGPHAGMSGAQFKRNEALGDRYWLYVVERADQENYKIWPIQNPAQRVTSFMFDDGWKLVAEEDSEEAAVQEENGEEQT